MLTITRLVLGLLIIHALLLGCAQRDHDQQVRIANQTRPAPPRDDLFHAVIRVQVLQPAASGAGIDAFQIPDRFREFTESHDKFTLTQVQDLEIMPEHDQHPRPLKEIAKIEVIFERDK
jgi:hypothetical protein